MSTKLPRATLAQKLQVLDYHHQSGRPQSETVEKFRDEVSISTSSFSEWLKNETELRKRYSQADFKFSKNSRRKVKFKYEKINNAMDKLVQGRLERNEPITEPILREHWSVYAHQYGVDDPKRLHSFSHGWLSQFKKRHGINKKRSIQNNTSRLENNENDHDQDNFSAIDDSNIASPPNEVDEINNYDPKFSATRDENPSDALLIKDRTNPPAFDILTGQASPPILQSAKNQSSSNSSNYDILANPNSTDEIPRNQFKPQEGLSFNQNNVMAMNFNHDKRQKQNHLLQNESKILSLTNPQIGRTAETSNFNYNRLNYDRRGRESSHESTRISTPTTATNEVLLSERLSQSKKIDSAISGDNNDVLQPTTAEGIEKFIFMFADRFFNTHQYEYPQTHKIFQELKDSFFNERFINNRNNTQSSQLETNKRLPTSMNSVPSPMALNQQMNSFHFKNNGNQAPTLPMPQNQKMDRQDHPMRLTNVQVQQNSQRLDEYFKSMNQHSISNGGIKMKKFNYDNDK